MRKEYRKAIRLFVEEAISQAMDAADQAALERWSVSYLDAAAERLTREGA